MTSSKNDSPIIKTQMAIMVPKKITMFCQKNIIFYFSVRKIMHGKGQTSYFPYYLPLTFSWLSAGSKYYFMLFHGDSPIQISNSLGTTALYLSQSGGNSVAFSILLQVMLCFLLQVMLCFLLIYLPRYVKLLLKKGFRWHKIQVNFLALP